MKCSYVEYMKCRNKKNDLQYCKNTVKDSQNIFIYELSVKQYKKNIQDGQEKELIKTKNDSIGTSQKRLLKRWSHLARSQKNASISSG